MGLILVMEMFNVDLNVINENWHAAPQLNAPNSA